MRATPTTPGGVSISASTGLSQPAHCTGVSDFGTTKPSRLRCFANATTAGWRTRASFTRTQTLVAPMTPAQPRKASTFDSADSRDASATLCSRSNTTASAPLASAFLKRSGRPPGTYDPERWARMALPLPRCPAAPPDSRAAGWASVESCRQHLWWFPCAGPGRRQLRQQAFAQVMPHRVDRDAFFGRDNVDRIAGCRDGPDTLRDLELLKSASLGRRRKCRGAPCSPPARRNVHERPRAGPCAAQVARPWGQSACGSTVTHRLSSARDRGPRPGATRETALQAVRRLRPVRRPAERFVHTVADTARACRHPAP